MAIADSFYEKASIGMHVDLIVGPKEIVGQIVALDVGVAEIKKADGRVAIVDCTTITYYEFLDAPSVANPAATPPVQAAVPTPAPVEKTSAANALNEMEQAIVANNYANMRRLLAEKETLLSLGYTERNIERMTRVILSNNMARTADAYGKASRLDIMQDNLNHSAEMYYWATLRARQATQEQKQKSVKKLQLYYVPENEYDSYKMLLDTYPDLIDLSSIVLYLFHLKYMVKAGKDVQAFLQQNPIKISVEGDYIYLLRFLLENPNDAIAHYVTEKLSKEVQFFAASKLALQYALKYYSAEEFESLRMGLFVNLYSKTYGEQIENVICVGHEVLRLAPVPDISRLSESAPLGAEPAQAPATVLAPYEQSAEPVQDALQPVTMQMRPIDEIVKDFLQDQQLGVVRANLFVKSIDGTSYLLNQKIKEIERDVDALLAQAIETDDNQTMIYLDNLFSICDISTEKLMLIIQKQRNDSTTDLYRALVKYNEAAVVKALQNKTSLRAAGYSTAEIEKFEMLLKSKAYAVGNENYEIASRLSIWGFQPQAIEYYERVAYYATHPKFENAVNQIVKYATETKNINLFEKHYKNLNEKQKKNPTNVRFINAGKLERGEYQALYEEYRKDPHTKDASLIYSAMWVATDPAEQEALLVRLCELPRVDYVFLQQYLSHVMQTNAAYYHKIVAKLLDENTVRVTSDLLAVYQLIAIDERFSGEITQEMVTFAMQDECPMAVAPILCLQKNTLPDAFKDEIYAQVIARIMACVVDMHYQKAYQMALFARREFPVSEALEDVVQFARKGIETYNTLPVSQDNYTKGKRLLMIGENTDEALDYFKKEIAISRDVNTVALCGKELLGALFAAQKYHEVIEWGRTLLIEKEVLGYSALVLGVKNALECIEDSALRALFLDDLQQNALRAKEAADYAVFIERLKLVEMFDAQAPVLATYSRLLEKSKSEQKINLDENTATGAANIMLYIQQDQDAYLAYLKEQFVEETASAKERTEAAVLLLTELQASETIGEHLAFLQQIPFYRIKTTEHLLELLYALLLKHASIADVIDCFTALLKAVKQKNGADGEPLSVLLRLQRAYQFALRTQVAFDVKYAQAQIQEYLAQGLPKTAQLTYIWLLAKGGETEKAKGILSLLLTENDLDEAQNETIAEIVTQYYNGEQPELTEFFKTIVVENQLPNLVEYVKERQAFVHFSEEERKLYSGILAQPNYRINVYSAERKNLENLVIKLIYKNPLTHKHWFWYSAFANAQEMPALKYCCFVNRYILSQGANDDNAVNSVTWYLKNDPEIESRYGVYSPEYYLLYKCYLEQTPVGSVVSSWLKRKKVFSKKVKKGNAAKEYISLLKQVDDGEEHIFLKAALFVASDCRELEYLYATFKHSLLHREQARCVQICVETLCLRSKASEKSIATQMLKDLQEENPDYTPICTLLQQGANPFIGKMLANYPSALEVEPASEIIYNQDMSISKRIEQLEALDACFNEALPMKRLLLAEYKRAASSKYYERIYHCVRVIMKNDEYEWDLLENAKYAAAIVTAMGKENRLTDIQSAYASHPLGTTMGARLSEFCKMCKDMEVEPDALPPILSAVINDNWIAYFKLQGEAFAPEAIKRKPLISITAMPYLQGALYHMHTLQAADDQPKLQAFQAAVAQVNEVCLGCSLGQVMAQVLQWSQSQRLDLIKTMDFRLRDTKFPILSNKKEQIEALLEIWDAIYGEKVMITTLCGCKFDHLLSGRYPALGYICLVRTAIDFYNSAPLYNKYIELLYKVQKRDEIIELEESCGLIVRDVKTSAYATVALILNRGEEGIAQAGELTCEALINVIILLERGSKLSEIEKIRQHIPARCKEIDMTMQILQEPSDAVYKQIKQAGDNQPITEALLKLLYCLTDDEGLASQLFLQYESKVATHQYIVRSKRIDDKQRLIELQQAQNLEEQHTQGKMLGQYMKEACNEFSLEEYAKMLADQGAEKQRLLAEYSQLSQKVNVDAECRRELLTKYLYLADKTDRIGDLHEREMLLGLVLYYCNAATDTLKSRAFLFETALAATKDDKRGVSSNLREALICNLESYTSISEVKENGKDLQQVLEYALVAVHAEKMVRKLFACIKQTVLTIMQSDGFSVDTQINTTYETLEKEYENIIARQAITTVWGKAYRVWLRMITAEKTALLSGSVIRVEAETMQCAVSGTVCFVIKNYGEKPVHDIAVQIVFGTGVHCRKNKANIKHLYGRDTATFAFKITGPEQSMQSYTLMMRYNTAEGEKTQEYRNAVQLVKQAERLSVGGLYTLNPVESNDAFYGREKEKNDVESLLNAPEGNMSMVMHGLKRVGKTSMLKYIARNLEHSNIPIYYSAQRLGNSDTPVKDMYVVQVVNALEKESLADDKCRSYLDYDYEKHPEQLLDFYEYLEESPLLVGKRILFMADEIESVFERVDDARISDQLYKILRVVLQERTGIRFIFCGADYLTEILDNHAIADIFEITERITLRRLDEDSLRKMIVGIAKDKLSYTSHALDRLWYYTKGHTYYAKSMCRNIVKRVKDDNRAMIYAYDVDSVIDEAINDTENFEYLSRFLNANDKKVIQLLCENIQFAGGRVSYEVLKNAYDDPVLDDVLNRLRFKDIIERMDDDDIVYYRFSIEMFRIWYTAEEYSEGV